MNLQKTSQIFTKVFWVLPFLLAASLLIILIFFQVSPKKTPPPKIAAPEITPPAQITSSFDLTGIENIPSPPKLPVYQIFSPEDLTQQAPNIAEKLNFNQTPENITDIDLGPGLSYSKNNTVLNVYRQAITYSGSSQTKETARLSVDDLKARAQQFLANLGQNTTFENTDPIYIRITEHDHITVGNPQQATYVKFSFNQKIENYPIVSSNIKNEISLDFFGNVLQFTQRSSPKTTVLDSYPVLSFDQAKNALFANKGVLLFINQPSDIFVKKLLLKINKAYIAYYQDDASNTLLPVWIFGGENQSDNYIIPATYAVFAIKND